MENLHENRERRGDGRAQLGATPFSAPLSGREIVVMEIWIEFRSHVLPWVIAGAVIGLQGYQENKRTTRLNELLVRQAQSLEQVHILLSTQGYLVPPMQEPRAVFGDFGSQ